jgi:hypothetical protein
MTGVVQSPCGAIFFFLELLLLFPLILGDSSRALGLFLPRVAGKAAGVLILFLGVLGGEASMILIFLEVLEGDCNSASVPIEPASRSSRSILLVSCLKVASVAAC